MSKTELLNNEKCRAALNGNDCQERNRYFQTILESIGDGVIITDLEGIIVSINGEACKIIGADAGEALGKHLYKVFKVSSGQTRRVPDDPLKRSLEKGKKVGLKSNSVLTTADGDIRYLSASVSPIKDIGGNISGVVLIFRDITRIKKAEEQLKKLYVEMQKAKDDAEAANMAKTQFLASISHEMRTPLNGIIGTAELALTVLMSDEQRDNVIIIKKCADLLLRKINDLIDISRIESGDVKVSSERLDIREIINDVIKIYKNECGEKGIQIETKISADIPQILKGDAEKLRQVIDNIVSNAVKFTDSGEIKINVEIADESPDDLFIKVSVSDTGIGISRDDLKKLFEPFSQVDGKLTRKYGGSGLGLYISAKLVKMMSGNISFQSNEEKGSTFTFTVKLKKTAKTDTQGCDKGKNNTCGYKNCNIMKNYGGKNTESSVYYNEQGNNGKLVFPDDERFINKCRGYLEELEIAAGNFDAAGVEAYGCLLKDIAQENDLTDMRRTALKICMCARSRKLEPVTGYLEKLKEYIGVNR